MPKNRYFPKGIIHGFLFKNQTSFHLGFFGLLKSEKKPFFRFLIEKNDFRQEI